MSALSIAATEVAPSSDLHNELALRVTAVRLEADDVISLDLASPSNVALPQWTPGAHIELHLPSGRVRQYSLCGATANRRQYRIAVLREPGGRGGSLEIHNSPLVGRTIKVRGPRNHFELRPSPRYVFIAGGIGVTPILAMVRSLGMSVPWDLYYGGRSRMSMAFVDELLDIGGDRVKVMPQEQHGLLDVDAIIKGIQSETAIYCCGPAGLLEAMTSAHQRLAPQITLCTERFTGSGRSATGTPSTTGVGAQAFELELKRSGVTAIVPPDRTTLDVIRDHVPDAPFSCEEGYCGSCETSVLEGTPDHRDDILTAAERTESRTMFPCVSRACSKRLVLDI